MSDSRTQLSTPSARQLSGLYTWQRSAQVKPSPDHQAQLDGSQTSAATSRRRRKTHEANRPITDSLKPRPERTLGAIHYEENEYLSRPSGIVNFPYQWEELRLDVDGRYPLATVSGTLYQGEAERAHWVAELHPDEGADEASASSNQGSSWIGQIWYKDGPAKDLPFSHVEISLHGDTQLMVVFTGYGMPSFERIFSFKSPFFHQVEFEFDAVEGTEAVLEYDTGSHPIRPDDMTGEALSIQEVFNRSGFDSQISVGSAAVPIEGAGGDRRWSDMELHDAMQAYWLRFADKPQWSMWVLFAALHTSGRSLGGIMFDDIGPNHRQGTAIFNDSFISEPPMDDPAPDAWVQRMKFWTAIHEMGHAFNLAHSWQKHLGNPWWDAHSEPESRSFMNYPFRVQGGQEAFFNDFDFRFDDRELVFLRHSPQRFVQMGAENWFDNHGFTPDHPDHHEPSPLTLRLTTDRRAFQFMEPVAVDATIINASNDSQWVDANSLMGCGSLEAVIKKPNGQVKTFKPFADKLYNRELRLLRPGEPLKTSLPLFAGTDGWYFSEPGQYQVMVGFHGPKGFQLSNTLAVTVRPPEFYDEQVVAQDYFSEDVARVLAMSGSHTLEDANNVLKELASPKFSSLKASSHAALALVKANLSDARVLTVTPDQELAFKVQKADREECIRVARSVLTPSPEARERGIQELTGATMSQPGIEPQHQQPFIQELTKALETKPDVAPGLWDEIYQSLDKGEVPPSTLSQVRRAASHSPQRSGAASSATKKGRTPEL